MSENLDERLKRMLASKLDTVGMTDEADRRVLTGIHQQIKERSNIMKYQKRKMIVAIAAAIAVTGTITAVAAGKIAELVSSINKNEAIHSVAELEEKAEKSLGTRVYIAEALSDGFGFSEGYVSEVSGLDEDGNTVTSYPQVYAMYGAEGGITLSIEKLSEGILRNPRVGQREERYQGIVLGAIEDQYLFLPPDASPSEEDLKLEAEGKLFISYGSAEEERKVFKHVSWKKDGLTYLLLTYGEQSLDDLLGMAKAYIDGAQ